MFPALIVRRTFGRVRDGVHMGGTGIIGIGWGGDPVRRGTISCGRTRLHDRTCTDSLSGVEWHRDRRLGHLVIERWLIGMGTAIMLAMRDFAGKRSTTPGCLADIWSFTGTIRCQPSNRCAGDEGRLTGYGDDEQENSSRRTSFHKPRRHVGALRY